MTFIWYMVNLIYWKLGVAFILLFFSIIIITTFVRLTPKKKGASQNIQATINYSKIIA